MDRWIGNFPTATQQLLLKKYENVLLQAQTKLLTSAEKVLKVIEVKYDHNENELEGFLVLTTEKIIFLSRKKYMVITYSKISDFQSCKDVKNPDELQLIFRIARSNLIFEAIKQNGDSQEFIEILETKLNHPDQEILTTVTHDFKTFLHAYRLRELGDRGVKITQFLWQRDDMGHIKNGTRLLREIHKNALFIDEGYYEEKEKKGNFIVVDKGVFLYEYKDRKRTAKPILNLPISSFTNAIIGHDVNRTIIEKEKGQFVLNSRGEEFISLLGRAKIPFKMKGQQRIKRRNWFRTVISSLTFLIGFIFVISLIFGNEDEMANTENHNKVVADTEAASNEAEHLAEEQRKQEEAARLAEEQRKQEEAARIAEEQRKQEEAARLAEEQRKQEEAARLAEKQRQREEAARIAAEKEKQRVANVYYKNCSDARAAGAAPVYKGDPGYGRHLDRDGDGAACEG